MAKFSPRQISGIDITSIIRSSLDAATALKNRSHAEMNIAFQKAVADGMSYADQAKLIRKQIEQESGSEFRDDEYIAKLEESYSQASKLARYSAYQKRYNAKLAEAAAGIATQQDVLNVLKDIRSTSTDDDYIQQIDSEIVTATNNVVTEKKNIVTAAVNYAKQDKTIPVLTEALAKVRSQKLEAQTLGDEQDVSEYSEIESSLTQQLETTKVNNAISSYAAKEAVGGMSATAKIDFLKTQAAGANADLPVVIGGTSYQSASSYWNQQAAQYVNGTSQTFGSFKNEISEEFSKRQNSEILKSGIPSQATIDEAKSVFDKLASDPNLATQLPSILDASAGVLSSLVGNYANKAIENAVALDSSASYSAAANTIKNLSTRYGVNLESYSMVLDNKLMVRNQANQNAQFDATTGAENLQVPDITVDSSEIPNGFEQINGAKYNTTDLQRGAYNDIRTVTGPNGSYLIGKPKIDVVTPGGSMTLNGSLTKEQAQAAVDSVLADSTLTPAAQNLALDAIARQIKPIASTLPAKTEPAPGETMVTIPDVNATPAITSTVTNAAPVTKAFSIPAGYEQINGATYSTEETQRAAYDDIQKDPTGKFLYGKKKPVAPGLPGGPDPAMVVTVPSGSAPAPTVAPVVTQGVDKGTIDKNNRYVPPGYHLGPNGELIKD